ncbi:MAG: hypothetical protein ACRC1M_02755, partial [Methanobacteriaceae archaeon]
TSGVHGSELSSQVATMKLIDALSKKNASQIKGTIYIIPFVCPKITSLNTRNYNGVGLNSVANKPGSVTNNIVNLAISLKVTSVGDFHCTKPGGDPGRNIILATKYPTIKSYNMAVAMSKLTGYPYHAEYQAGKSYPGALEDVLNLKKIPTITAEVRTPHGTIASGSVTASFKQLSAFLKYNKMI